MRNLGGAIGLALIDTVIFSRSTSHASHITSQLRGGNADMAVSIGIPREAFMAVAGQPLDAASLQMVEGLVKKAALVSSINDAWALIAALTLAPLVLLPLVKRS